MARSPCSVPPADEKGQEGAMGTIYAASTARAQNGADDAGGCVLHLFHLPPSREDSREAQPTVRSAITPSIQCARTRKIRAVLACRPRPRDARVS